MTRLDVAILGLLVFALALAAWTPSASAGTAEAPEVTDPAGDQEILVVGVDPAGFASADIVAGWITEDADNLYFNIQISGTGADGAGGPYTWFFRADAGGVDFEASATSSADQPTPSGAATAAALDGGVITLTVPQSALAGATELTGLHIVGEGGLPAPFQAVVAATDTAPDDGADAGISYQVGAGGAPGPGGNATAGDSDGDGLNDTWETDHFGNVTLENGTGDPDGDGLNNTAEQDLGTDPTEPDTDGDGLGDAEDAFPLNPNRPGTSDPGGNTTDSDGDGLPDGWEREHFGNLNQTGSGDPDADDLNNTEEHAAGTDPLEADTDGDGVLDGDDAFPLDPAQSATESESGIEPELYAGAPMFAAIATLCLLALARIS